MSENEESIKNRYNLAMFYENALYLKGLISAEILSNRLKNLEKNMQKELKRAKNIEKVHKTKKRVESAFE